MSPVVEKEIVYGNSVVKLETGKVAREAAGAVVVTHGETVVLCAATYEKSTSGYQGFVPFSVHFMVRSYALGRIPYSFFKREGKPSEYEVLVSRLIDRSIRPLFPSGFCYETQLHCIVLSYDKNNDPDIAAVLGSVAALKLAGIPLKDVVGCARVGKVDGEFVLNPTREQAKFSELDMVISGNNDSVIMIESESAELPKDEIKEAVMFAHKNIVSIVAFINDFVLSAGAPTFDLPMSEEYDQLLVSDIVKIIGKDITNAIDITNRHDRRIATTKAEEKLLKSYEDDESKSNNKSQIRLAFKEVVCRYMRDKIFKKNTRIDGRAPDVIRDISIETNYLPRVHGSALFTRGSTQALVSVTMGSPQDEQIIDSLGEDSKSRFMLHYNFPPFSVGETASPRMPSRREIGHGRLAWRAVRGLVPNAGDFPYTLRVVSEIMEADGSSSMATVCGTSLALFDAGIQIKSHVAGIALGIIKEDDKFVVLSDILGDEDYLGEMDFKLAGTRHGITALQMDVKGSGLMSELDEVLDRGITGINYILDKMEHAIPEPRQDFKSTVPLVKTIRIDKNKIRDVIGASGKMIREICSSTGVKIDIDPEGAISIVAPDQSSAQKALKIISEITEGPKLGMVYSGTVSKVVGFGIFVHFCSNKQGLVHISELKDDHEYKEGDNLLVKVIGIEEFNRFRLIIASSVDDAGDTMVQSADQRSDPGDKKDRPMRGRGVRRVSPPATQVAGHVDADSDDDYEEGVESIDMEDNDYNSRIKCRIKSSDGYIKNPSHHRAPSRGPRGRFGSGGSSTRRPESAARSDQVRRAPAQPRETTRESGSPAVSRRVPESDAVGGRAPRRPRFF